MIDTKLRDTMSAVHRWVADVVHTMDCGAVTSTAFFSIGQDGTKRELAVLPMPEEMTTDEWSDSIKGIAQILGAFYVVVIGEGALGENMDGSQEKYVNGIHYVGASSLGAFQYAVCPIRRDDDRRIIDMEDVLAFGPEPYGNALKEWFNPYDEMEFYSLEQVKAWFAGDLELLLNRAKSETIQ